MVSWKPIFLWTRGMREMVSGCKYSWSFTLSPTVHLLLCTSVSNRGLWTPDLHPHITVLLYTCKKKKRNIVIYFHEYVSILTLVGFSGPYIGISFPMSPYCKSSWFPLWEMTSEGHFWRTVTQEYFESRRKMVTVDSCDEKIWGMSYELSEASCKGEKLTLQTTGNISLISLALSVMCNITESLAFAFAQSQL